jgi:hypothetical protein
MITNSIVNQPQDAPREGNRSVTRSILYDWVQQIGLRHQGVILAAQRGCDGVGKQDVTKPIMRAIRAVTLVPYDARELFEPKGYMYYDHNSFDEAVAVVSKSMDEYPLHFILHMIHGLEVIGYKHPDFHVRRHFNNAYCKLVRKFHMVPESEADLDARLTEDRIKDNTVQG